MKKPAVPETLIRYGKVSHGQLVHYFFGALISWTSVLISSGVSLPEYFGMWCLPFVMISRSSSAEAAVVFSETSDGPPKWRPSALFP